MYKSTSTIKWAQTVAASGILIHASELRSILDDEHTRLVDCRFDLMQANAGRLAWETEHIPGAVYADLDRDLAAPITDRSGRHPLPDGDVLVATFSTLGIDASSNVVVYDGGSGAIAARAWWLLRWLGHERVALLDKGFAGWQQAGYPLEHGVVTAAARSFRGVVRRHRVLTSEEILSSNDSIRALKLIDARDSTRFRGEQEPIDDIAGHIPGAMNMPFTRNLKADGGWKSSQALRDVWAPLLGNDVDTNWSVMCGSGVTACHLVVSGLRAGYREPRLYAGSWSEWIRDPLRPLASGA